MPLKQGNSQEVINYNIRELTEENENRIKRGEKPRSHKQIVAIALASANKKKKLKNLSESMIDFLNGFKNEYPLEINAIIDSFKVFVESEFELNIKIPENINQDNIKELKNITQSALDKIEKSIETKSKAEEELKKSIEELNNLEKMIEKKWTKY